MSRRTLISLAVVCLSLGAGVFGYLYAQSNPAAEVRRDGLEATIDVSAMQPGELIEVKGLDLPVWVLRRSPAMLTALGAPVAPLDDPQSARSTQPAGLDPGLRSARPEYFVLVPIFHVVNGRTGVWSTVSVQHAPADATPRLLAGALHAWAGGFRDNAGRGIHFDYAGRVYRYANVWNGFASNIAVPRHEFVGSTKLRIDVANLLSQPNLHGDAKAAHLVGRARRERWARVFAEESATLQACAQEHRPSLFDRYGASDPAELFAVASEVFFEQPQRMAAPHAALYAELSGYYRVDSLSW